MVGTLEQLQNKEEEKIFLCFSNSERNNAKLEEKSCCRFQFGKKRLKRSRKQTNKKQKEIFLVFLVMRKKRQTKGKSFWVFE